MGASTWQAQLPAVGGPLVEAAHSRQTPPRSAPQEMLGLRQHLPPPCCFSAIAPLLCFCRHETLFVSTGCRLGTAECTKPGDAFSPRRNRFHAGGFPDVNGLISELGRLLLAALQVQLWCSVVLQSSSVGPT